jgi:NAD(P)-dependent dehydrogenase (short-subunit alcohol dehydrogenase family)
MSNASAATQGLGRRSTAEEALQGASLTGKLAIVTGASSGLGIETTRVLAGAGADVMMACRDIVAAERIATELRASLPKRAGALEVRTLDLADLESVARFVQQFRAGATSLDLLINNAGVMATPRALTKQGYELQLGTNHLGHFLLTRGLLPVLDRTPGARVVTLSSSLHARGRGARLLETLGDDTTYTRRKYAPFDAYGDAKLANILFTRILAELAPNVSAYSLHPGVIPTALSRSMGTMGFVFRAVGRPFMKSVAQGAATTVFAATAASLVGRSGAYLSDCAVATPSDDARDDTLAQEVWARSEALVDGW